MNSKSAKAKGERFERHLREALKELDPSGHRTKGSGAGLDKGDIRLPKHNIVIEAKNQKTIKIIDWWEQAKNQAVGYDIPVLAIRNPKEPEFKETLIVLDLGTFIDLLQGEIEEEETSDGIDPKLKWALRQAADTLKTLAKRLENI